MILVEVELMVVLCSLQVVLGILDDLLDVLHEVNCISHPNLATQNNINWQPNLFPIHQLKWRVTCALSRSRVDGKFHMIQKTTPF